MPGARAAQPGEFTMRAFLAGKKDLTQAEAVLAVIDANNSAELDQALMQMAGGMTQPLHALRDDLLNLLADIEAALDFSEEDIQFVNKRDMLLRLGTGMAHFTNLKKQLDQRATSHRPFRVALAGEPNAGKSSLFNALAGAAAAIVSPVAGTTRDYVSRTIALQGTNIELIDTAGRQESSNEIDEQAQRRGREQIAQADLVVWCVESTTWRAERRKPPDFDSAVLVVTKVDLITFESEHLVTSAKTGHGVMELRRHLAERARSARAPALAPSLSRAGITWKRGSRTCAPLIISSCSTIRRSSWPWNCG
jgi:tRNA modification GTPase